MTDVAVEYRMSRRKVFVPFMYLMGLVVVVRLLHMVGGGGLDLWTLGLSFLPLVLIGSRLFPYLVRLRLDEQGFDLTTLFMSSRRAWSEVDSFNLENRWIAYQWRGKGHRFIPDLFVTDLDEIFREIEKRRPRLGEKPAH